MKLSKNVLSGSTVCDNGFEFDVALELKICKSEFPDRENRGYNDYDSLASSKPSNFIENTGMNTTTIIKHKMSPRPSH